MLGHRLKRLKTPFEMPLFDSIAHDDKYYSMPITRASNISIFRTDPSRIHFKPPVGTIEIEIGIAIEIERKRDNKESQRKATSTFQDLEMCGGYIVQARWNFRGLVCDKLACPSKPPGRRCGGDEHVQLRRLHAPTRHRIMLSINAL